MRRTTGAIVKLRFAGRNPVGNRYPTRRAFSIFLKGERTISKRVLLIGCGKMGGALLGHWMKGEEDFTVTDPALESGPHGARLVKGREEFGSDERFDVIIVAIKPQMVGDILPGFADLLADDGYVLSIAAGCSIERLSSAMDGAPVIRVMPNLPAAIGRAVSGICAADGVDRDQLAHAQDLMGRAGRTVTVDSEDALDRVTAVAGSGPGYVFEIARAYVAAAEELGFDKAQAREMVLGTIEGTIAMAQEEGETELAELRNSVTSKGGTTAAGLDALNGDGVVSDKLRATLQAAYDRAVELR
ncbi:pyrroline-5-carboxylate reductase family protein [Erythrobacter sp. LQ02-29]|uniref:pyrroline-5-carboxylate reductase family protein n=1 Tax=Erythrobacter sp. LQ02-29 TaxID=2920384 RepID=UPI00358EFEAE